MRGAFGMKRGMLPVKGIVPIKPPALSYSAPRPNPAGWFTDISQSTFGYLWHGVFDTFGNLIAIDSNNVLYKQRPNGSIAWARQVGQGAGSGVGTVALDASNNIFVSSEINNSGYISRYSPDGLPVWKSYIGPTNPWGLAVDATGSLVYYAIGNDYGALNAISGNSLFNKYTGWYGDGGSARSGLVISPLDGSIYIIPRTQISGASYDTSIAKFAPNFTFTWGLNCNQGTTSNPLSGAGDIVATTDGGILTTAFGRDTSGIGWANVWKFNSGGALVFKRSLQGDAIPAGLFLTPENVAISVSVSPGYQYIDVQAFDPNIGADVWNARILVATNSVGGIIRAIYNPVTRYLHFNHRLNSGMWVTWRAPANPDFINVAARCRYVSNVQPLPLSTGTAVNFGGWSPAWSGDNPAIFGGAASDFGPVNLVQPPVIGGII